MVRSTGWYVLNPHGRYSRPTRMQGGQAKTRRKQPFPKLQFLFCFVFVFCFCVIREEREGRSHPFLRWLVVWFCRPGSEHERRGVAVSWPIEQGRWGGRGLAWLRLAGSNQALAGVVFTSRVLWRLCGCLALRMGEAYIFVFEFC